ncbi:MAG: nucleoside recognition domain-containing protein [Acidobacteriota bacterium]
MPRLLVVEGEPAFFGIRFALMIHGNRLEEARNREATGTRSCDSMRFSRMVPHTPDEDLLSNEWPDGILRPLAASTRLPTTNPMLNGIFIVIVLLSTLVAGYLGRMELLSQAVLESSKSAVTLALGLIGIMALFLGLMRVASDGGILRMLSRAIHPVLRFLFPQVPADHPAMSAMILNIASNMLGLGNAATPFGIKAMMELDRLNPEKGTASDAMVLFLAINTSGLALLPTGVIGLRASAGSQDAAGILVTTWFASGCATVIAILSASLLSRLGRYKLSVLPRPDPTAQEESKAQGADLSADIEAKDSEKKPEKALRPPRWAGVGVSLFWLAFLAALTFHILKSRGTMPTGELVRGIFSFWILPALIAGLVLFGWARGVKVYDSVIEGAKEGFDVAIRIIPYLVAILAAVGMFRASGGLDILAQLVSPITNRIGMPAEVLPVALVRPLSGSGALGIMTEIIKTHHPDSFIGYMASTLYGSTETTFYVLAVYFGAVGIKKTRHALPACLTADATGILAAVLIVNLLFR